MDIESVQSSYARWAPVYDTTFGAVTNVGRRRAVEFINTLTGAVLEVGVGTGLSLPLYSDDLQVTGIDFSDDMLAKAQARVERMRLDHVAALRQMDARELSVVPEPERVMAEISRVLKPGGRVVITNHFVRSQGVLAHLERIVAPFANTLGWHSDFEIETVLKEPDLALEVQKSLPPLGMMTFLVLTKTKAS